VTLTVSVHQRAPDSGELGPDLLVDAGAELAGFEAWRTSVYGSEAIIQRGARFLPRLVSADLIIEGSDLIPFQAECTGLIRDVERLGAELGIDAGTLRLRLSNVAAATKRAILIGGVVWIS